MFKVLDGNNELIMIAPLKTIVATPSVCVHLNGRGPAWFYRGTIYLRRHGQ